MSPLASRLGDGKVILKSLLTVFLLTSSWVSVRADAVSDLKQRIQDAHGKVIYVDFWASWCKPCRHSFPWMNDMKRKYESHGLSIITVNLDKERHLAEGFLKENPAEFDIIYDENGDTARQFKLKGMPMSFVIDRSGKPVSSHVGFNEEKQKEYENELRKLLQAGMENQTLKKEATNEQ
ncbi:TlpA disulfide reductase family protein [Pleionea litopenaei]|uniref:TlpA disulfide reductase family protein n=1 Tax=Pleionea litopenaei TaxID=3070815 RepID=A0AA51RRZ9_9GAMM|nr:TlpA disulfide reductase family protein [Pleionea sp. HL-JVS1]WMS86429.1 TlpA disulfide reductase family protein [Pleionea sp. HL-JVS1]